MLGRIVRIPRISFPLNRFSSSSHFLEVDEEMFNRKREIQCLSQVLMSRPQCSVITGPVDSGKTRLLEHLLVEVPNKMTHLRTHPTPVCSINLRKGNFYAVQSLVDSLSIDMGLWLHKVTKWISGTKPSEVAATTIDTGGRYSPSIIYATTNDELGSVRFRLEKSTTPSDSLNKLLRDVADRLPSRTFLRGKHCKN